MDPDRIGGDLVIQTAPPTTTGIAILAILVGLIGVIIKGWFELKKVKEATKTVEHEVTPNSGQSLRDQVDRLNKTVDKMDDKMDKQAERLVRVETIINGNGHNYGRRSTDR